MTPTRIEWPTVAVFATIAAGLAAVLMWHEHLPWFVEVAALGLLSGWYLSFQHEVVHGHPTPWRRVNWAMGWTPVALLVNLSGYERTHLTHHNDANLTDPDLDPESRYVSPAAWQSAGPVMRWELRAMRTVPGRLVLGPIRYLLSRVHGRRFRPPTRQAEAREVTGHLIGIAAVMGVVWLSGLHPLVYLTGAMWVGLAITMLRSFAEHQAVAEGSRTAVVRSNWFFSLLYLNNNLHVTHHALPGAAWYRLRALHEELGSDDIAAAGAGLYRGYWELLVRYWRRPFGTPTHPLMSLSEPSH